MVLLLLLAVVTTYAAQPQARKYAGEAFASVIQFVTEKEPVKPAPHRVLMMEAAELFWQKRWDEANDIYERLCEMRPDAPEVWFGLGLSRHHLGDYAGAIEANLKALSAPDLAPAALFSLAEEYAITGKTQDALDALDRALHLGFQDFERIAKSSALDPIRADVRSMMPPAPEFHAFTFRDGTTIQYSLVLPRDFDESKTYPTLLGFSRSRQNMNAAGFALDNYWGLQAHYQDWIVISPLSPGRASYTQLDAHWLLPELLDHFERRFNIEGGKFHLAGFSNGGTSSFKMATDYPDRFQSVTTFPCYEISEEAFDRLYELKGMRISLFYGDQDDGPSVETSRKIYARLIELGIETSLTVYRDEGHVVTSLMGDRLMTLLDSLRGAPAPDASMPIL